MGSDEYVESIKATEKFFAKYPDLNEYSLLSEMEKVLEGVKPSGSDDGEGTGVREKIALPTESKDAESLAFEF